MMEIKYLQINKILALNNTSEIDQKVLNEVW